MADPDLTPEPAAPPEPDYASPLAERLAWVAAQLRRFAKGARVTGSAGYAFTSVDDMADAIRPLLADVGVVMYPHAVEVRECREVVRQKQSREGPYEQVQWRTVLLVTWRVACHTEAGPEHIDLQSVGEALDTSDKSANKAQTAARKYAMVGLFNISTGDDPDPDYHRPGEDDPQQAARGRRQGGQGAKAGGASKAATDAARAAAGATGATPAQQAVAEAERAAAAKAAGHDVSLDVARVRWQVLVRHAGNDAAATSAKLKELGLPAGNSGLRTNATWLKAAAAFGVPDDDPMVTTAQAKVAAAANGGEA